MDKFLWGAFGGAAVETYRLWILRNSPLSKPPAFWLVSLAMIAVCGGFTTAVATDESALAEIYVGVSTPYIIGALLSQAERALRGPTQHLDQAEDNSIRVELYDAGVSPPALLERLGDYLRGLYR